MTEPEPPTTCPYPGCGAKLYPGNRSGVCRRHNHAQGFCRCVQCSPGGSPRSRIRSREELIAAGLLRRLPGERSNG